jgi:hypothetical protein
MSIKTIDVFDSFHPERLLDVRFEYAERPEYIRSFRSSYASRYELMERVMWRDVRREEKREDAY